MNILFLANNNLSPTSGGIERTTYNLIKELSKDSNFKIFAVFMKIPEKIEGTICIEDTIFEGKQIDAYISQFKIDIVVFPGGAWYTNLLKTYNFDTTCKIVTCLHSPPKVGEDYIIKNLNLEWLNKDFLRKLKSFPHFVITYLTHPLKVYKARKQYSDGYVNSDAYILLSKSYFNLFKKYGKLVDEKKLYAIGNALSFEESFSVQKLSEKKNDVLFVGRFDEISKRISFAIKAWHNVKKSDWNFKIVGFGKDEKIYRNLVSKDNVKNLSFEGKQNPITYYTDAKIFIMTSSFEGWPMTLLEALQMGCVPIVMNSFGSLNDIIEHGCNGFIVKNGDIRGMSNAIQTLIDDDREWLRLSKNAIESSEKFTLEKTAKKWKDLFYQIA